MKTIKIVFAIAAFMLVGYGAQGQSFGAKLGDAFKKSAENAAIRNAERKTSQTIDKGVDKTTSPSTYKEMKQKSDEKKKSNAQTSNSDAEDSTKQGESRKQEAPAEKAD